MSETFLYSSPLGLISYEITAIGVSSLKFRATTATDALSADGPLHAALARYFAGESEPFHHALDLQGTDFQRGVWEMVRQVPAGQTASYREIASRMGKPDAVRAVGAANGANPVAIIVPCHRIVGSDGSLTGYAYGLELKAALLSLEGNPQQLSLNL